MNNNLFLVYGGEEKDQINSLIGFLESFNKDLKTKLTDLSAANKRVAFLEELVSNLTLVISKATDEGLF